MQYPASCFSGRAGFSDLDPPDGGWSQNPAGTVLIFIDVMRQYTDLPFAYLLNGLSICHFHLFKLVDDDNEEEGIVLMSKPST